MNSRAAWSRRTTSWNGPEPFSSRPFTAGSPRRSSRHGSSPTSSRCGSSFRLTNTSGARTFVASRAVLLLSGGLDSYTAGALARRDGFELYALTVRYGQIHAREVAAARDVAKNLGVVRHIELDVDLAAFGGSTLVGDGAIPKDRDLDETVIPSTY